MTLIENDWVTSRAGKKSTAGVKDAHLEADRAPANKQVGGNLLSDAGSLSTGKTSSNVLTGASDATLIGQEYRQPRGLGVRQLVVLSLFIIGLIVCVTSLFCIIFLPSFVSNQISKRLVLKNNSLLLERWSKPNVPMYFKVWMFDVVNAQEVIEKRGTKAKLREVGPFVFHLKRQKDIVSFAGDNLYYTERKIYHFSPELSCCAFNTTVTIPNIPLVAVVDRALGYNLPLVNRFIPRLINRAIQSLREQLFVKRRVEEILFEGYEVELLKMVSRVGSLVGMPQMSQKFAILKGRNDTWRPEQDGVWAINTGARDRRLFGRVSSWNSYRQLPFWAAPQCNQINGSDGTLFPPPIKRTEPLYIFNQELCRTVNLVYDRPSDIRAIKAYRYVLNPLNFARTMRPPPVLATATTAASSQPPASGANLASLKPSETTSNSPRPRRQAADSSAARTRAPWLGPFARQRSLVSDGHAHTAAAAEPKSDELATSQQERLVRAAQEDEQRRGSQMNPLTCFCDRKNTNLNGANVCEFDGLIDLSKCTKQAQVIFGSMPHFHLADPRLLRQVEGLQPNTSKHTTFLDIEPNTGLVLGGKRRVQLNLLIKHNNEVDGFENINDMLVPVVWFEESAQIPEESAQKFRSLYTDRIRLVNIVLSSLFIAALGLLLVDLRLFMNGRHRRDRQCLKFRSLGKSSSLPRDSPAESRADLHGQGTRLAGYQDALVGKLGNGAPGGDRESSLGSKRVPVGSPLLLTHKEARRQLVDAELKLKHQTNKSVEFTVAYNDTRRLPSATSSDGRPDSRHTDDGRGSVVAVGQPIGNQPAIEGDKSTRM